MFFLSAFSFGLISSLFISPSLILIVLNFALLFFIRKNQNSKLVFLAKALVIFQIAVFCGHLTIPQKPNSPLLARVENADKKTPFWIEGKIISSEKTLDGSKAVIKTNAFYDGDNRIEDKVKIIAYLPIDPPSPLYKFKSCLFLSLPKTRTNPNQFDYRKSLANKGIYLSGELKDKKLFSITKKNFSSTFLSRYKNHIRNLIIENCGNERGFVLALLLGERGLLNNKEEFSLIRSGLFHLIALSGLHIGIIILILYFFLTSLRINPFIIDLTLLIFLPLYALIVKDQPSVIRAIIMAFVFISARLLLRQNATFNSLLISFVIILAFNPYQIEDVGFQFTFLATLGIVALYKVKPQFFKESSLFDYLFKYFWIGLSAQLFTLPVIIFSFQRISIFSFFLTPFATIFLFPLLACGIIFIFGGSLIPYFNTFLLMIIKFFAKCFLILPVYASKIDFSSLFFPLPHFLYAFLFFVCIALIVYTKEKIKLIYSMLLLLFVALSFYFPDPFNKIDKNFFIALDVGQGNCSYIHYEKKNYLIDCPDTSYHSIPTSRSVIEPFLAFMKTKKIEGIFITHWDRDHSGSLKEIVRDLKVGFVAYPSCPAPPSEICNFIEGKGIKMMPLKKNDKLNIDKLKIEILHPDCNNTFYLSENNLSLVFRVSINNKNILFTGDIEKEGEKEIFESMFPFEKTDILIVPHHGAKNSLFIPFIDKISPKISLFSVGKNNRFNHPNKSVLNYYRSINSKILRTDKDGAILIIIDEKKIKHFTYANHPWEKNLLK